LHKAILAASAFVFLGSASAAANINIQLDGGAFRVTGWTATAEPPEGWTSVFSVYAGAGNVQSMLGTYAVLDHVLTFHPRFPITAGVHYHASSKPPEPVSRRPSMARRSQQMH